MPKISIIIPVYKVEKYLERCLDSVLNQTLTDFELLLIDDGSPDRSGEICDAYAARDSRIVVIHQENGGPSKARNTGLDAARGDYIGFVDADDYIEPQMYETLYQNIIEYQADISVIGFRKVFDGYCRTAAYDRMERVLLNQKEALWEALRCRRFIMVPWDKLYRRELLQGHRFPVGMLYEDSVFNADVFREEGIKVVFDPVVCYNYVQRGGSTMNSGFNPKQMDYITVWQRNYELLLPDYPDFKRLLDWRRYSAYFTVLDQLALSEPNYRDLKYTQDILTALKKETLAVLCNPYFTYKRRVLAFCAFFMPCVYDRVIAQKRQKLFD